MAKVGCRKKLARILTKATDGKVGWKKNWVVCRKKTGASGMVDPAPDPSFYSSLLCRLAGLEREFLNKKRCFVYAFVIKNRPQRPRGRPGGRAWSKCPGKKLAKVSCRKKLEPGGLEIDNLKVSWNKNWVSCRKKHQRNPVWNQTNPRIPGFIPDNLL